MVDYIASHSKNSSATILEQSTSPFDIDEDLQSQIPLPVRGDVQADSSQLDYSGLVSPQERNAPHQGRINPMSFEFSEQAEKSSPQEEDVDISRFLAAEDEEGYYSQYCEGEDDDVAQYLAPDDQEGYYRSLEEEEEELNQPQHIPKPKIHKWTNNDKKEMLLPWANATEELLKCARSVNGDQVPVMYAVQNAFLTVLRKIQEAANSGEGTCWQGSSNQLRQTIGTVVRFYAREDETSHQVHEEADFDVLGNLSN